jgi:Tol biopolymer transport system component
LDAREWRYLPGTEGPGSAFWSPDSRYLAFVAQGQLKKLDTAGGPPETLAGPNELPESASGTWNRDDVLLVGSWGGGAGGPLWKIAASGGAATMVTQVDASRGEFYHTSPTFLPDGRQFLYFRSGPPETQGIYVGSLDAAPDEQSRARILASALPATYANGSLFFMREGALLAQPFDVSRLRLEGAPVVVGENVRVTWYGTAVFSVSPGGVLAYDTADLGETTQLTWVDRRGGTLGTVGPEGTDSGVTLSPDGRRAVVSDVGYGGAGDLWTLDLSNDRRTRLTFGKDVRSFGVWSPDGERVAYAAGNLGDTLFYKASSGVGEATELLRAPGLRLYPTSWSADGRFLLYHVENAPRTGYDLWVLPLDGAREPVRLLGESYNEWAGVFSPDMRWVAFSSLETGAGADIHVRPFLVAETGVPALGESKWQISTGTGNWAWWRKPDEILINTRPISTAIFAVPVDASGAAVESGISERLVSVPNSGADVTADGQRFLIAAPTAQRSAPPVISVVLNWPALVSE